MENIHAILEKYGVTVAEDKKADFDKAVAENYKTIADFGKVTAARDNFKSQLDNATNSLKEFEGVNVEDLKGKITSLTNDLNTQKTKYEQQLADLDFENALDLAITGKKGKSVKAVKALLDVDALKASKKQREDIDAALETLKKDNGYLFDEDNNTPPPYAGGTGRKQNPNGDMTLRSALSEKFSKKG